MGRPAAPPLRARGGRPAPARPRHGHGRLHRWCVPARPPRPPPAPSLGRAPRRAGAPRRARAAPGGGHPRRLHRARARRLLHLLRARHDPPRGRLRAGRRLRHPRAAPLRRAPALLRRLPGGRAHRGARLARAPLALALPLAAGGRVPAHLPGADLPLRAARRLGARPRLLRGALRARRLPHGGPGALRGPARRGEPHLPRRRHPRGRARPRPRHPLRRAPRAPRRGRRQPPRSLRAGLHGALGLELGGARAPPAGRAPADPRRRGARGAHRGAEREVPAHDPRRGAGAAGHRGHAAAQGALHGLHEPRPPEPAELHHGLRRSARPGGGRAAERRAGPERAGDPGERRGAAAAGDGYRRHGAARGGQAEARPPGGGRARGPRGGHGDGEGPRAAKGRPLRAHPRRRGTRAHPARPGSGRAGLRGRARPRHPDGAGRRDPHRDLGGVGRGGAAPPAGARRRLRSAGGGHAAHLRRLPGDPSPERAARRRPRPRAGPRAEPGRGPRRRAPVRLGRAPRGALHLQPPA